jgi:HK97 family phage prohead protease
MTKYLRGLAVPYGQAVPLYEPPIGAYYESFRQGSLVADLDHRTIPLLLGHDSAEPVGRIRKLWDRDDGLGLGFEATLHGRTDYVAEVVDSDIMTGVSIGFLVNPDADTWFKTEAGIPAVIRQQAQLREISLTWCPVYESAQVGGIDDHSVDWAEQRAFVTEMQTWLLRDRIRQAHKHGRQIARTTPYGVTATAADRPVVDEYRRYAAQCRTRHTARQLPAPTPAPDTTPAPVIGDPLSVDLTDLVARVERLERMVGTVWGLPLTITPIDDVTTDTIAAL